MPGRQAHGRPLVADAKAKAKAKVKAKSSNKRSKSRAQNNALDAFGIAQKRFSSEKTPRFRNLDIDDDGTHVRAAISEDEEDEADGAEKKRNIPQKAQGAKARQRNYENAEDANDSEGNEWPVGGLRDDDENSEIESDDAFGGSDNELFQGFTFRGSKSKEARADESEDDSNDEVGDTLGEDAIDLATALDQYEEESDTQPEEEENAEGSELGDSELEEAEDSESSSFDSDEAGDAEDDEDADMTDNRHLDILEGLIDRYGGEEKEHDEPTSSRAKVNLSDLGLTGLSDPYMRKSVKLLQKESKEKRSGATKKISVPLPRREQGRIDRAAAYEKTNETLDRWADTVKQNRRAEHLIFPLPENSASAGIDTNEMQPLTVKEAGNELEQTIMSIMDESGLSMQRTAKKPKPHEVDDEGNILSRKEAVKRKRMKREMMEREAKRAKRIKKIKSKAYHRVHRKQRERDEVAAQEAMAEAGEIDSDEEREAQDRRRALERVGQRHKDSKWAKLGSKTKRAVWDDDFRTGLTEMARKDEELRRRKAGRKGASEESDSDASSDSEEQDEQALRRQLDALEKAGNEPRSGLLEMKFMQKAEAAKKAANDDLIQQIRRELDGEGCNGEEGEGELAADVGRRSYGTALKGETQVVMDTTRRMAGREDAEETDGEFRTGDTHHLSITTGSTTGNTHRPIVTTESTKGNTHRPIITTEPPPTIAETAASTAGAWSRGEARRKKTSLRPDELDLNANILTAAQQPPPGAPAPTSDATSSAASDADENPTLDTRHEALIARAFTGDDVLAADFAREKADTAAADDDKVLDKTLPGWGSWVGEGVGAREAARHRDRFLTAVRGVRKQDRRDAKLEKVIISERRVKKNDRFLASQLPHPFESRQQYERSLRLPVGPEWMTKQSFQASTKPRVLVRQGVITAMSKPRGG